MPFQIYHAHTNPCSVGRKVRVLPIFTNYCLLLSLYLSSSSTETIRLIRDGRMEVGEEGDYIPIATLSPSEWLDRALRWATMRAILLFHWLWGTKSQDSIHKLQPFWRERRAEAESSRGLSGSRLIILSVVSQLYQAEDVPFVVPAYHVFARMPGKSYRSRFKSRMLSHSTWCHSSASDVILFVYWSHETFIFFLKKTEKKRRAPRSLRI